MPLMNGAALSFPARRLAQQFRRMYEPSMLAVELFRPELSVLLMVLATVNESM